MLKSLLAHLPEKTKNNLNVRLFGFFKVPLIFLAGVRVISVDADRCEIVVPFKRRNKNHLNSLYFGSLGIGADVAGGLIASYLIEKQNLRISLVFKDFTAQFLKRAEADTHFICEDGDRVQALIKAAHTTGERVNDTVRVVATTPSVTGDEPVAEFALTLSLKSKE
ncbi:MAG: DUF4442 domain-containing protein [Pseudomonadota bacterium]